MSPERARSIAKSWVSYGVSSLTVEDAERAILAACTEERRAALTEARKELEGVPNLSAARRVVEILRDREPR